MSAWIELEITDIVPAMNIRKIPTEEIHLATATNFGYNNYPVYQPNFPG